MKGECLTVIRNLKPEPHGLEPEACTQAYYKHLKLRPCQCLSRRTATRGKETALMGCVKGAILSLKNTRVEVASEVGHIKSLFKHGDRTA